MTTSKELDPAVIAPECAKGDCGNCRDMNDHPCEHNCHVLAQADADAEIFAMRSAYEALKRLDSLAQGRVIDWLTSRLEHDRRNARSLRDEEPPF